MPKAICLLSGGLDSSVALAITAGKASIELCLTIDYGQRSRLREIQSAKRIAKFFNIPHKVVEAPFFAEFSRLSALTDKAKSLPNPSQKDLGDMKRSQESARAVWVPNRNGIFIEIAAAFAESLGVGAIITGFNAEEAKTFPDNSGDYLKAINRALAFSTSNGVQVSSPTLHWTKAKIVCEAKKLNFPLELLWSCYRDSERMCGLCESCQRLKRALRSNEVDANALFEDPNF